MSASRVSMNRTPDFRIVPPVGITSLLRDAYCYVRMAMTSDNRSRANNMTDTDTLHLPIDVIIHIMSYLSASDRMAAGLVNHAWREASLAIKFVDQEALVLGRPRADNLCQILKVLHHSTRPFHHFIFREVELKKDMSIWSQYGSHMRSLVLLSCDLSEKTLVEILKQCTALRVLRINACRECLVSSKLLEDENDVKELSETCYNLQELGLGYNLVLNDALFNRLVSICPNLESLSLMGCQIAFHMGLYKKYYPDNKATLHNASKFVLTFGNTLRYLKLQAHKLRYLNFGYTLIDGPALVALATLKDLKLESIVLQGCFQLTIPGLKALTVIQTNLKVLDVSFCARITDECLICICKNLTKLETLRIKRCRSVTDSGVQKVRYLRNLKELDISEDELLTGDCISRGICYGCHVDSHNIEQDMDSDELNPRCIEQQCSMGKMIVNLNMEYFSANNLHLHEDSMECISKCFPNLKSLEVGYCSSSITDNTLQMIFKELTRLHILKIANCDKITDAGLTGITHVYHDNFRRTHVQPVLVARPNRLRLTLCSRAVEEIVQDAQQKQETMKLCDPISRLSQKTCTGISIARLRCLRELDLSGCNRITDITLIHAFAFPELKVLSLSQCQQITHVGLDYLTKNNPAIEDLNLNQCHNVTDIGIAYVAQRLHRLKRLLIQACSQLTDNTLDCIKLHCKTLHYLDTRHCCGMTGAGRQSLRHLNVDWIKHMDDIISPENEIPPAPPLQALPPPS